MRILFMSAEKTESAAVIAVVGIVALFAAVLLIVGRAVLLQLGIL
jgi:hypothetical protein